MPNQQHAGPGPSASTDGPEPSLAERARTLISLGRIGSLSTHSRRLSGFPFGSLMPYAADERGRPVFFVSSMAMHTQNLGHNPRSSLLVAQLEAGSDPLGAARMTIVGSTADVPSDEVRELYLSQHENAKVWQDYSDFAYYRLEVTGVYFIGGFGVMGWISAEDYEGARPDPLAEVAAKIIQHMNADHAEGLRLIARYYVGEGADEASVTAVDRLGFHLKLKSGDRVYGRRLTFPREVTNSDDARGAFVDMLRLARSDREGL